MGLLNPGPLTRFNKLGQQKPRILGLRLLKLGFQCFRKFFMFGPSIVYGNDVDDVRGFGLRPEAFSDFARLEGPLGCPMSPMLASWLSASGVQEII